MRRNIDCKLLVSCGMAVGFAGLAAPVFAETPPSPPITAPQGSTVYLGPWLEDRLQEMVQSCTPSKRLKMTKINQNKEFDVSAVTPSMRAAFELNVNPLGRRIRPYEGDSMIYYFANVYQGADFDTLKITSAGSDYLDIVDKDAPEFVKASRVDQAVLVQTCATAMSGAIDANAGYSLPIASVKAAFDADYQGSNSYSLNLIKTKFRSPLWEAYTGVRSATQSPFHAAMTLLRWYELHPSRAQATDNKLLIEFEGVGVTQILGAKRNIKVAGSASYSVGIPLIGGSQGGFIGETSWFTSLSAEKYKVAVMEKDGGGLSITPAAMPSLSEALSKAVATASVSLDRLETGEDLTLYNRNPRTLTYVIDRLPPAMCTAAWRVFQKSPATTVAQVRVNTPSIVTGKDGWDSCRVPVTFWPSPTMPLNSSQTLDIGFEYTVIPGANAKSLRLQAETVSLPALQYPHLLLRKTQSTPTSEKQTVGQVVSTKLNWKFTYQIMDNNQVANETKIDITGLSTSCAPVVTSPQWIEPTRRLQLLSDAAGKSLDVNLELQWDGDYAALTPAPDFSTCKLSGDVIFTLTNGQSVTREFPTLQFLYPIPK